MQINFITQKKIYEFLTGLLLFELVVILDYHLKIVIGLAYCLWFFGTIAMEKWIPNG